MNSHDSIQKVGIFGGTFDPVHLGHLILAEFVREELKLDEIWFLPSNRPPHKQDQVITSSEHRIQMLKIALKDMEGFKVSLIEFERDDLSYTYDTLVELKKRYPQKQFFLIIGADMAMSFESWYRYQEIPKVAEVVAVTRQGYQMDHHDFDWPIRLVNMPHIGISSTLIRERIRKQQSVRFLIPDEVFEYIKEYQLYAG